MEDGEAPIAVEIAPALRVSWLGHLARSLLTLGAYDYWRLWDPRMPYRPRLVAVNGAGQHFTLFTVLDDAEEHEKLARLRAELRAESLDVWCDRYVVPSSFVDGTWRPG